MHRKVQDGAPGFMQHVGADRRIRRLCAESPYLAGGYEIFRKGWRG